MRRILLQIFAIVIAHPVFADGDLPYVWVQLGADQTASLRVITDKPTCSAVVSSIALQPRGPETITGMTVGGPGTAHLRVCSADFDLQTAPDTITVDHHTINLPKTAPQRVALIGDTGCRVEGHSNDQNCTPSADQWIFAKIAKAVAAAEPELILHVGDYVYRYNCYSGTEGCGSESELKEWSYWENDFFQPASSLLPTAPWVFARGNHEDCEKTDRGWRGWSLFFSAAPVVVNQMDCAASKNRVADPAMVRMSAGSAPALNIFLYDTADEEAPRTEAWTWTDATTDTWMLTHVPLWYAQAYYTETVPTNLNLVLSGHEHLFRAFQPTFPTAGADSPGPLQIVQGASGTKLDSPRSIHHLWRHPAPEVNMVEKAFSFNILERISSTSTTITLCVIDPNTDHVTATQSWVLSHGAGQGRSVTKGRLRQDVCTG